MNYQQRIIQAYRNTPWRIQLQIIGLFSASLVFIAIIASVYLNVSARASTIGRRVQSIQATQEVVEREIEDLETHLADITSAEAMAKRADEAGYEVASPQNTTYLVVKGYPGKQVGLLAPAPQRTAPSMEKLPGDFTVSLFEWIRQMVYLISLQTGAYSEGT